MFRTILTAIALASAAPAMAEPTFAVIAAATPSAELIDRLNRVCQPGAYVLSDKATVACAKQSFPRLKKDGSEFVSTGIGGELNALMRQVPASQ